jgi:hypothetical protein
MADKRYAEHRWEWLREQVWTKDEASEQLLRWPDRAYLRELLHAFDTVPLLAVPKSRAMMVSWAIAAWSVHKARYFPNNAIFIQSENEDKAAYVVGQRCAFIEDNLDAKSLRRRRVSDGEADSDEYKATKTSKGLVGRMEYGRTGSTIWAVPQGGDVVRSYTFSKWFMDECEFQEGAHEAVAAALPRVEKGAGIVLVSTPNGPRGPIAALCREIGFTKF